MGGGADIGRDARLVDTDDIVPAALDTAGVRVRSMRTKSNRLEELFVRMTARDPSAA